MVQCIKHVYPDHIVLQLDCTNTLNDQLLENVMAELEPPEGWDMVAEITCPKLEYNVSGTCYIVLKTPEEVKSCQMAGGISSLEICIGVCQQLDIYIFTIPKLLAISYRR